MNKMEVEKYVLYDLQWLNIKRSIPSKRINGDQGVGREGLGFISQVSEAHHSERCAHTSINQLTHKTNYVNELKFFFNRTLGDLLRK